MFPPHTLSVDPIGVDATPCSAADHRIQILLLQKRGRYCSQVELHSADCHGNIRGVCIPRAGRLATHPGSGSFPLRCIAPGCLFGVLYTV